MNQIRDTRRIQFAAVGLAFALFGAIDLLVLIFVPAPTRGAALLPPLFSGVIVLATLPVLLGLFERQQERIERQQTEIETLHAMDHAILSEMEMSRLLQVASDKALSACDGDAAGVALFDPATGTLSAEAYTMPDVPEGVARTRFASLVRGGNESGDTDWITTVAPLTAKPGERAFGYLTVARRRITDRAFSRADIRLLEALAGTLRIAVSNARALTAAREARQVREELRVELKVSQAERKREQAFARAMTEGLLPEIPSRIGAWVFSQHYQPQSDEAPVGGDLYDLFQIAPHRYGIFIADVSGKGLDAARKIALVKYALRSYAREHPSPAEVLKHLNDSLFDEPEITSFVTLFYGVLDERDCKFVWASAGHETPVLRRCQTEEYEFLMPTGPVLGAMPDITFDEVETDFQQGDGLLLFTDGLSEARATGSREFLETEGVARELDIICSTTTNPPIVSVADAIMLALNRFTGGKLSDDTALLWMQYEPDFTALLGGEKARLVARTGREVGPHG